MNIMLNIIKNFIDYDDDDENILNNSEIVNLKTEIINEYQYCVVARQMEYKCGLQAKMYKTKYIKKGI